MRNRASGWVYWNLVLDKRGGPNLAGNFVDSPAYVHNASSFILNPSFFYLSHFSRAIPPGSVAVDANVTCTAYRSEYCQYVAFRTPLGHVAVIMTNDEITTNIVPGAFAPHLSWGEGKAIEWVVSCGGHIVNGSLPWKGIQTLVMPCV